MFYLQLNGQMDFGVPTAGIFMPIRLRHVGCRFSNAALAITKNLLLRIQFLREAGVICENGSMLC